MSREGLGALSGLATCLPQRRVHPRPKDTMQALMVLEVAGGTEEVGGGVL